jgi:hypothetical protein
VNIKRPNVNAVELSQRPSGFRKRHAFLKVLQLCTTFFLLSVSLLAALYTNKKTNILRLSSVTKWNKEINCATKREYKELHGCFFVVFTTDLDILLPTQQLSI